MEIGKITQLTTVKVLKRPKIEERSRSELTLLWELIQRNPERARDFLDRLKKSLAKPQDVVF